jgi:ligand-binding SRPBCC domain-containing protein
MTTIGLETLIGAPVDRCFMLSLSVDLHIDSTHPTRERAIAGVTSGVMQMGEQVTWEARHLGLRQRLTSQITEYNRPSFFQDTMLSGPFSNFQHDHRFKPQDSSTLMTDELRFSAPLGLLGRAAERLFLRDYLTRFLLNRNEAIRVAAESRQWEKYLLQG